MTFSLHNPSSYSPSQILSQNPLGLNTGSYLSTEHPAVKFAVNDKLKLGNEDSTKPPSTSLSPLYQTHYLTPLRSNSVSPVTCSKTAVKFAVNKNLKVETKDKNTLPPYSIIYACLNPHSSLLSQCTSLLPSSLKNDHPYRLTLIKILRSNNAPLIPWLIIQKPNIIAPQSIKNYNHIKKLFWQKNMTHQQIKPNFQKIKTNCQQRKSRNSIPSQCFRFRKWVEIKYIVMPHLNPQMLRQTYDLPRILCLLQAFSRLFSRSEIIVLPNTTSQWCPICIHEC